MVTGVPVTMETISADRPVQKPEDTRRQGDDLHSLWGINDS